MQLSSYDNTRAVMLVLKTTMQRIRETFRKRQATIDSPESSSQHSRDASDDKGSGQHSEPSSPKATFSKCQPHQQSPKERQPPVDLRHQLKIPVAVDSKKQRSVSFDEIRPLEMLQDCDTIIEEGQGSPSLEVPTGSKSARSKSFDSATAAAQDQRAQRVHHRGQAFLEIPKWKMFVRRSSAGTSGTTGVCPPQGDPFRDCVHCILLEEFVKNTNSSPPPIASLRSTMKFGSVSSEGSQDADCEESEGSEWFARSASASGESIDETEEDNSRCSPSPIPLLVLSVAPDPTYEVVEDLGSGITVISLEVPVLPKSGRSASVDSSYLQVPKRTDIGVCDVQPGYSGGKNIRSRSVDIALPVGPDGPYLVVPNDKPSPVVTQ